MFDQIFSHFFLQDIDFISWGFISRSGVARSLGNNSMSNFSKNFHAVFNHQHTNLHALNNIQEFPLLHILVKTYLFDNNHFNKREMIFHCFWFTSPWWLGMQDTLSYTGWPFAYILKNCLVRFYAHECSL